MNVDPNEEARCELTKDQHCFVVALNNSAMHDKKRTEVDEEEVVGTIIRQRVSG